MQTFRVPRANLDASLIAIVRSGHTVRAVTLEEDTWVIVADTAPLETRVVHEQIVPLS